LLYVLFPELFPDVSKAILNGILNSGQPEIEKPPDNDYTGGLSLIWDNAWGYSTIIY